MKRTPLFLQQNARKRSDRQNSFMRRLVRLCGILASGRQLRQAVLFDDLLSLAQAKKSSKKIFKS